MVRSKGVFGPPFPVAVGSPSWRTKSTDEPEAVVDDYSRAIKAGLSDDQDALYPQIEREFLATVGAGTAVAGGDR